MSHKISDKQQRFKALWLAETFRLQEEQQGPLEDSEAIRHARRCGGDLTYRILTRAYWLGKKSNLLEAQDACLLGMKWAMRLLCVFALFLGFGLVLPTFSATERTINIFSALASLLGLNLLMLIIWLLGAFVFGQTGGQLGKLWLWISTKFTKQTQPIQLLPGLLSLLHQKRLERWWIGQLSNGLWFLMLSMALITLLLLLATQRYGFIWQTTILSGQSFVTIVQVMGYLPSLIGFPVPSETLILQSGDAVIMTDTARQAWAMWLVGVLVIYGIIPRLILLGLCHLCWRLGCKKLTIDTNLPSYNLLKQWLMPDSQIIGVTDAAPVKDWSDTLSSTNSWAGQGALLVGIELDPAYPWPPQLPSHIANAGILDNRLQRRELLEQLTLKPVARLLMVCDPRRSIDRGSTVLISELANCAKDARVWLITSPDNHSDTERLHEWQQSLDKLQIPYGDELQMLAWLGANDG